MTTCRDVVSQALHVTGIVGVGEDPDAAEATLGMDALQGMFDHWVANGMFGRLTDVYKTVDYTARERERVHVSGSPTITIPTTYREDGEEGTDRPPYDLSLIEVQSGSTRAVWLYDRSAWVNLVGLTLNSTCPLADTRGKFGFACCLAEHFTGFAGASIPPQVMRAAQQFRHGLSYKLGSDRPAQTAEYF